MITCAGQLRRGTLAIFLLLPETLRADNTEWDWARCLAAARERPPPELAAADHAVSGAQDLAQAAKAAFRPRAGLEGGAGIVDDTRDGESGGAVGYTVKFAGELPLYPNREPKGMRRLRAAEAQAAAAAGARVRADYELRLRLAFLDGLAAQERLPLAEEIRDRTAGLARAVETRHRTGQEHSGHLAAVQAAAASAQVEVDLAVRALALCRDRLAALLDLEPGQVARLAGELAGAPPPADPGEPEAWVQATPEYAAAKQAVQQAEARTALARSQTSYQFDAVANASPRSDSWNDDAPEWFAGVRLKLPLYEGGRARQEAAAARSEARQGEAHLAALKRDLRLEFLAAWNDYQAATARQALLPARVKSADLRADIARREYEAGLAPLAPWEAAESEWAAQRQDSIRIRREAAIAQARWERLANVDSGQEGNEP